MAIKRRGPKSYTELIDWLQEGGYQVEIVQSGHRAVLTPHGKRLASLPNTPSDHRSFRNSVSMLRRLTGLSLRK